MTAAELFERAGALCHQAQTDSARLEGWRISFPAWTEIMSANDATSSAVNANSREPNYLGLPAMIERDVVNDLLLVTQWQGAQRVYGFERVTQS